MTDTEQAVLDAALVWAKVSGRGNDVWRAARALLAERAAQPVPRPDDGRCGCLPPHEMRGPHSFSIVGRCSTCHDACKHIAPAPRSASAVLVCSCGTLTGAHWPGGADQVRCPLAPDQYPDRSQPAGAWQRPAGQNVVAQQPMGLGFGPVGIGSIPSPASAVPHKKAAESRDREPYLSARDLWKDALAPAPQTPAAVPGAPAEVKP